MSKHPYLYVADTYNNKIKRVDVVANSITTLQWVGTGHSEDYIFNEPSGLCITNDHKKIYITDTNNHSIKIIHLSDDFHIQNVTKFNLKLNKPTKAISFDKRRYNILTGKKLIINRTGGKIILGLKLLFGDEIKLTMDAPQKWAIICPNELWNCVPQSGDDITFIDTVITTPAAKEFANFYVTYNYVICKGDKCIPKNLAVEYTVYFVENVPNEISENTSIITDVDDMIFK